MPTREYINNVVAMAGLALDAYQPDRVLYQALQPLDDEDRLEGETLFATVAGESRDLRSVTAVFGAVQLAFDAAMVVTSYTAELPRGGQGERNIDFLRTLASEPTWTLEIEELSDGSFLVKLRAVFATRRGRSTLIAAAVIATAILTILVPVAIVQDWWSRPWGARKPSLKTFSKNGSTGTRSAEPRAALPHPQIVGFSA